jgi:putative peptidoglycan lipid II flippase
MSLPDSSSYCPQMVWQGFSKPAKLQAMKLFKSTALVSALTFTSRLFGFVRESIVARVFGASALTDAFFIAFRIPNMLRQFFSEGAFATAFVPVLSEYKAKRSAEEKRQLINFVAGTLGALLLLISGLGVLIAPALVSIFAPGYWDQPLQFQLTTDLLRITFPYIFFVSLCGFSAGILNTHSRFAVPALTPILLNIAMIVGALFLTRYFAVPIKALAWSVLIGGVLQLLVQIPALLRLGLLPRPKFSWKDSGVRKIISNMVPTMFGASVAQINLLVDTAIASAIVVGSVTWLNNADRLLQFPQGVFGVALSAVILPHLSKRFSSGDGEGYQQSLDWALRAALIIAVPATITMVLCADALVWSVFGYGNYTARDVHMASLSLATLALGFPAFISVKVLAPAFFARMDTKTPVKAALASMFSNMGLCALFVFLLMHTLKFDAPHMGISLASALAGYINAGLLLYWLRRQQVFMPQAGWRSFLLKLLAAGLALALVILAMRWVLTSELALGFAELSASKRFGWLLLTLALGALGYLGTLILCGLSIRQMIDPSASAGKATNSTP